MKPFTVQVDPIWVFGPLMLRPFHFDGPTHASHAPDKHPVHDDPGGRGALSRQGVAAARPSDGLHWTIFAKTVE